MANFLVTTFNDENDGGSGGTGLSLREAIILANTNADRENTITLLPSIHTLSLTGQGEDASATGDLDILSGGIGKVLNIVGTDANQTIVDATGSDRVFDVVSSGATLNLSGVTVTGGNASSFENGGGIYVSFNASLNLNNSLIHENLSQNNGAGLVNYGTANISNSIISNNSALNFGGGIDNGGTINISNSTISGNFAVNGGGGIQNFRSLSIRNSTISGNSTEGRGGGLFNRFGIATIGNSTLSGNSARANGGGILNFGSGSTTTLSNSIIANSMGADIVSTDGGSTNTTDANLIEDGSVTGANIINVDPRLAPLANNGGFTPTHALLFDSPAINASNTGLTTDQRGIARPQGSSFDLGAVEFNQFPNLIVDTLTDEFDGNLAGGDVSLREALFFTPKGETVNFASNLSGGTIALTLGQLNINRSVNILGLGANNLTINGSNNSRVFNIDNGNNLTQINVTIDGLTITGGKTTGLGGGILNRENLTLRNSYITNNTAQEGAGINNDGGILSVINSTIANNTANTFSGGIDNDRGTATISNSTISGNTANLFGGIATNQGTATISNSTITNNNGTGSGNGLFNGTGSTTTLIGSIVAGNNKNNDVGSIVAFTSGGNNLIGNNSGATGFTNGVNGDIVGNAANPINPQLGILQNNGGSTPTHGLLSGSPAIDAGNNVTNPDQRGIIRPQDGNNDGIAISDIGAFELLAPINGTAGDDTLTGTAFDDTINGLGGNDSLNGGAGNDTLFGGAGNDSLNGGTGADNLVGGTGNEIYYVDNLGDLVTENANEGTDMVKSTISYTLGNNVERLYLLGNDAIDGTGNSLNNRIKGNDAANSLNGGSGNDTLTGDGGNDVLVGGLGNDTLTGGTGADRFTFNAVNEGSDRISDFSLSQGDSIAISASGFGGGLLAGVEITTEQFALGGAATDAFDRLIYHRATGALFFDADGTGAIAQVQIATIANLAAINNTHFLAI